MSVTKALDSFFQFCLTANEWQSIVFIFVLIVIYGIIKLTVPVVRKKFESSKEETTVKALDTINKMMTENTKMQANSNNLLEEVVRNNSQTMEQVSVAIKSLEGAITDLKQHAATQDERTMNTQILVHDVQATMATKDALSEVKSSMVRKEELKALNNRISAIQNNSATKADIMLLQQDIVGVHTKVEQMLNTLTK